MIGVIGGVLAGRNDGGVETVIAIFALLFVGCLLAAFFSWKSR